MKTPTPEDIKKFLKHHELTGSQASKSAYLSGDRTIRKYTGGTPPRQMSGAVWFTLHAKTMLGPETIAAIEEAMDRDCSEV